MRVLLLGMPDVASSFDRVMRMPNLGIASIAANLEDAEAYVLDLVLHSRSVARTVREQLERLKPDVVGLSAMTFQYDTAKQVAGIVRKVLPTARIVLGGYHATLAFESISADPGAAAFDFLVRGEGETAMNLLVRALQGGGRIEEIPGLSYRLDGAYVHNPRGPLQDLGRLQIPARCRRLGGGYHYFRKPFDVVETSRGCFKSCRFCSVKQMYAREYRCYDVQRVLADIADARMNGARGIFFVDDNINLRPGRLFELCRAICDAGLNDLEYITQADVAGFLQEPDLPEAMRSAGFTGVFLGIESIAETNWRFLRKRNAPDETRKVIETLRRHGIGVAGGFIVGNPDEDAQAVRAAFRTALSLPLDHAIMWCLTPYPGTEARKDLMADGLVANADDFRSYNGFICNVRTRHLAHSELVRLIAREGAKLYFNPRFFLRSSKWPRSLRSAWIYFRTVAEYLTQAPKNRLFASRHRM